MSKPTRELLVHFLGENWRNTRKGKWFLYMQKLYQKNQHRQFMRMFPIAFQAMNGSTNQVGIVLYHI